MIGIGRPRPGYDEAGQQQLPGLMTVIDAGCA